MIQETRKIWGAPDLPISATCIRVPVLRAHSVSITFECERPVEPDGVRALLEDAPGVRLVDDAAQNYFPMPKDASGRDEILVGRIRRDLSDPSGRSISLFAVVTSYSRGRRSTPCRSPNGSCGRGRTMALLETLPTAELRRFRAGIAERHAAFAARGRRFDMTRGKPSPEQLDLSAALLALPGPRISAPRTGSIAAIMRAGGRAAEARALFAPMLGRRRSRCWSAAMPAWR